MKRITWAAFALLGILATARAGEIGHFNGGIMSVRDYVLPDPGFYGLVYNYWYTTDRLNDSHGDKIKSVTINPGGGPGVTINLDVNVDLYAVAPTFVWVTDIKPLGIKYGAILSPSFANSSLSASLNTATGTGRNSETSSFGVGDLFVQPVTLAKSLPNWDFTLAYGFWAPTGKYDTDTVTLPVIGPVQAESADNIGYGYWTHQFQGAVAWYPMTNKATAVVAALTYETNGKKEEFPITPGDALTLNWGISQFLPLKKDMTLLLEVGPAGYDSWQITDDSGSAAGNLRDEVHGVGGQLGVTYVPWVLSVNCHGFYEYFAKDRFQGASFGINIAKKF